MAENIIHLVLARTPDAPEGVKGISVFLVPKFLVNEMAVSVTAMMFTVSRSEKEARYQRITDSDVSMVIMMVPSAIWSVRKIRDWPSCSE